MITVFYCPVPNRWKAWREPFWPYAWGKTPEEARENLLDAESCSRWNANQQHALD